MLVLQLFLNRVPVIIQLLRVCQRSFPIYVALLTFFLKTKQFLCRHDLCLQVRAHGLLLFCLVLQKYGERGSPVHVYLPSLCGAEVDKVVFPQERYYHQRRQLSEALLWLQLNGIIVL